MGWKTKDWRYDLSGRGIGMTTPDIVFFISGSITGFTSWIYLFIQAIKNKRERWLLFLLAFVEGWDALMYVLVLSGHLPLVGYGVWVRPITFVQFMAPSFLWMIVKPRMNGKKNEVKNVC
jgi:hypothetical protein